MGDDPALAMGWTNNPHSKKIRCIDCFGRTSEMGETCSTHRSDKNCVHIFFVGKSERKRLSDVWAELDKH